MGANASAEMGAASAAHEDVWGLNGGPPSLHTSVAIILVLLTLFAVLSNGAVVVIYWRRRALNPSLRPYLLSLSTSDLVAALSTNWLYISSSWAGRWLWGPVGCSLYGFVQGFCALVSITTVAGIALERCVSVAAPAAKRAFFGQRSTYRWRLVAFAHLYCLLITTPPLLGWSRYSLDGFRTSCCFEFVERDGGSRAYVLFLFGLGFVLPVGTVLASFLLVARFALRRPKRSLRTFTSSKSSDPARTTSSDSGPAVKRSPSTPVADHQKTSTPSVRVTTPTEHLDASPGTLEKSSWHKRSFASLLEGSKGRSSPSQASLFRSSFQHRERRMLGMMSLVTGAFLLAWSPYAVIALVAQFAPAPARVSPYLLTAASLVAKSATCYNPIIYAFLDRHFRRALLQLLGVGTEAQPPVAIRVVEGSGGTTPLPPRAESFSLPSSMPSTVYL